MQLIWYMLLFGAGWVLAAFLDHLGEYRSAQRWLESQEGIWGPDALR